jgi:tRNA G18 (ribose-2'-O)-methylase SpoU
MSAGINTKVREESRNDPQSLSTSGDSEDLLNQKQQQWFPYEDSFKLNDETTLTSADVIRMLAPFLVDGRKQRIEEVVANRTYSVCPVVEGLLDLGNVSAVFRSADALGFQSVHVISNVSNRRYKKNRKVSAGAEKWLDVEMWENTGACIATLKARGYRIAVTHIAPDTVPV